MSVPSPMILRKLECLRLVTKTIPLESIVSRLVEDGVFTKKSIDDSMKGKRESEREDTFLIALENASREGGTVSLLYYEWTILPEMKAKITIVTPAGVREFEYADY